MLWISKIELRNIKTFANAEATLRPLTVLIGPNNSGKSNLLGFLAHLATLADEGFRTLCLPIHWRNWIRRDDSIAELGATLVVTDLGRAKEVPYSLDLRVGSSGEYTLVREELSEVTGERSRVAVGTGENIEFSNGRSLSGRPRFSRTRRFERPRPVTIWSNSFEAFVSIPSTRPN